MLQSSPSATRNCLEFAFRNPKLAKQRFVHHCPLPGFLNPLPSQNNDHSRRAQPRKLVNNRYNKFSKLSMENRKWEHPLLQCWGIPCLPDIANEDDAAHSQAEYQQENVMAEGVLGRCYYEESQRPIDEMGRVRMENSKSLTGKVLFAASPTFYFCPAPEGGSYFIPTARRVWGGYGEDDEGMCNRSAWRWCEAEAALVAVKDQRMLGCCWWNAWLCVWAAIAVC